MRAYEFITEASTTNLLIVDVQPSYDQWCGHLMDDIIKLLHNHSGRKVITFNGEYLDLDSRDDVIQYYLENGLSEDTLDDIEFIEKDYGFFRGWMDNDIDNTTIIKGIRALIMNRKNDTRDLNWEEVFGDMEEPSDPLYLPDGITVNFMRNLSPFYMMGGGRSECLREIELLCNAFNIRYKRIDSLIYG